MCATLLAVSCPVHGIGRWLEETDTGSRPFAHISGAFAMSELRRRLVLLDIVDARGYWLHDFRRGHADDMRRNGKRLKEILFAGEWRSPGYLQYLNLDALEADCVVEAHLDDSDGDEEADA